MLDSILAWLMPYKCSPERALQFFAVLVNVRLGCFVSKQSLLLAETTDEFPNQTRMSKNIILIIEYISRSQPLDC